MADTSDNVQKDGTTTVLHATGGGGYDIAASRGDIDRIDISDVDLLITLKNGNHYVIPNGGIAAMGDHPPSIAFGDGTISLSALLSEVGAALDTASSAPMPATFKIAGGAEGGANGHEQELAKKVNALEAKLHQQQQQIEQQQKTIDKQGPVCKDDGNNHTTANADCKPQTHQETAPLNLNTSTTLDQMIQELQQQNAALHDKDYDYTPPQVYQLPPAPAPPAPGVTPPINLEPIITLFMGNMIGTTTAVINGVEYFYGGGGAAGSDAISQIGPRDALQWSPATITGDNNNDVIYAEGPLVGNMDPATSNSTFYAKQLILAVAGYFTELNAVTIKGVPSGVTIVGATNEGGGVWSLPAASVLQATPFTLIYNTGNYNPSGSNTFSLEFDVTGLVHGGTFSTSQSIEFEYMNVTNASQVTNPGLVYDSGGYTKEIYILPTLDQPNIITAGDGNDTVVGSRSNDTITLGNGNDQVTDGSGTNAITVGNGNSTIVSGDGNNTITLGTGSNTVTLGNGNNVLVATDVSASTNNISIGNGNNSVTVGSGTDTITTGDGSGTGNNTITVNSAPGTTNLYIINATNAGTETVNGGDGDYNIHLGSGVNTVAIGNSTTTGNGLTTFDSTITASGAANVTAGAGAHDVTLGAGVSSVTLGAGSNTITTAGGGGTISTQQGNQKITLNSIAGSKNAYSVTTTGTGTTNLTGGDDNYTIVAGNSGANNITIGNGNSTITATTGTGLDTIVTGNGNMTIAAGAAANDSITVGTSATAANTVAVSEGNGGGDHVTLVGSAASTGTVAIGSGASDVVNVGAGNYTITNGGANGVTNTVTLTSGGGDSITGGNGNNIVYEGSHTTGTDTITLGSGNNTVFVGTGTDVITAGAGANTINFSNLASALTINFGTTGASTAAAAGVSDSFTGFTTLFGTNNGDTITLNTGNLTVHAGTGNDMITLGSGTDIVFAGNGNNTIAGTNLTTATGDNLVGGTGNNFFTTPDAGTVYNGTNGAALTAIANNLAYTTTNTSATNPFAGAGPLPADLTETYVGGVATINLSLQTQINEINYGASPAGSITVNLSTGNATGTPASTGSTFTFTPTPGYSTIDAIVGNGYGDNLIPSFDNSIMISANTSLSPGGGDANFEDMNTNFGQIIIDVGVKTGASSGGLLDTYYMGPAAEIIVGNTVDGNRVAYGWNISTENASNSAAVVANFDSVSHTFTNTLFTGNVAVNAYSGTSFGAITPNAAGNADGLNIGNSALSWSAGDYYVPVIGTSTNITSVMGNNNYINLIYGGSANFVYYAGGSGNFFYAGSGGSYYMMNGGWGVADVLTPGGVNIFTTHNDAYNNSNYNMYVILNKALDTGTQASKDAGVNLTFGGATYAGFVYGWGNVTTPVGNALTYVSGYQDILGYNGNDYIVGDNIGDQIDARLGNNTIILGDGINIVTALEGNNNITSSSAAGQTIGTNTLNFEVNNDGNSGVLANQADSGANTMVEAFLNFSISTTQSTFFGSGGDTAAFFGSAGLGASFQIATGISSDSYSTVQAGIISTLNGSDYTTNTAVTPASNSNFIYDNVYSGASTIIGHAGNDIFIDNIGTSAEVFNGSADHANVYYLSPTQIADVTVTGGGTGVTDILRIEGASPTDLNTLVTNSAKYTGIDVIDLRSGTDTATPGSLSITMGSGSTTHANTYALSEANLESLTHDAGSTATLVLKLDNGDTFTAPTAGGAVTVAHSTSAYFGDIYTVSNSTTHTTTTLDIHYGTG